MEPNMDQIWIWDGVIGYAYPNPGPSIYGLGDTASFFKSPNVMYLWGENNEIALDRLRDFKRVVLDITKSRPVLKTVSIEGEEKPQKAYFDTLIGEDTGTAADVSRDEAQNVSRLSTEYSNVVGAINDDLSPHYIKHGHATPAQMQNIYETLKQHNSALDLYGVFYGEHFGLPRLAEYVPYVDIVNIWVGNPNQDLDKLDEYIDQCPQVFAGKPILLGLYLYDYVDCQPIHRKLLEFQFNKAVQYIKEDRIIGCTILAAALLDKIPDTVHWVKGYLEDHFQG